MSEALSIAGRAPWLADPALQRLLAVLNADGEQARVVGGAVRNTLLDRPVSDIDIATTALPDETMRRAAQAGFRAVPTGYDHGTVTVVAGHRGYEVTTLRRDVETDGRRARVRYGRDWREDAERRDFTINALYCDADGTVHDDVGGIGDLRAGLLRFIGDAEARIGEDYLRILRFFRFHAWYGSGRPDAEGLKACARLKGGLAGLSAERVWAELRKLLSAPDPGRTLLWMRQTGVLTAVLPESEKWGIDAMPGLLSAERDLGWTPDPLVRLEAIVPPDAARMATLAERLRMANAERDRLVAWAFVGAISPEMDDRTLRRLLFEAGRQPLADRLRLALASARAKAADDHAALHAAANHLRQVNVAETWEKPDMPVRGADLIARGIAAGPQIGAALAQLTERWIASDFTLSREALLETKDDT